MTQDERQVYFETHMNEVAALRREILAFDSGAYIHALEAELLTARGAMTSQDARNLAATERLGLAPRGCDTPDALADEVEEARRQGVDMLLMGIRLQGELIEARSQLDDSQARECRMRESSLGLFTYIGMSQWLEKADSNDAWGVTARDLRTLSTSLSASGPCSHQQDVCRMREALARLRNCDGVFGVYDASELLKVKPIVEAALAASQHCPHADKLAEAKKILNSVAARIADGRGLSAGIQQEYLREINAFYGITPEGKL